MDVFPTPLSRRNLFRAGLAAAAVSVTAGCARITLRHSDARNINS